MKSRMRAGRLRHCIDIQKPTATADSSGQMVEAWTSYVAQNVPAEILGVAGGETMRGRQVDADATSMVTIRWRDDVNPTHRIKYGSRTLNIISAYDPTGDRVELQIQCREEVNG